MRAASERDIAFAMMRFWGRDAAKRAFHYALEHEGGSPGQAARWYRVHDLIGAIRADEGSAKAPAFGARQALRCAPAATI